MTIRHDQLLNSTFDAGPESETLSLNGVNVQRISLYTQNAIISAVFVSPNDGSDLIEYAGLVGSGDIQSFAVEDVVDYIKVTADIGNDSQNPGKVWALVQY
jgi:hypothetical protein